jgi:hypothetical protein
MEEQARHEYIKCKINLNLKYTHMNYGDRLQKKGYSSGLNIHMVRYINSSMSLLLQFDIPRVASFVLPFFPNPCHVILCDIQNKTAKV